MKTPRSADDPTSATAFFQGLPVSVWMISPNSRSLARSSEAARPRISPRSGESSPRLGSGRRARDGTIDVRGGSPRHLRHDAVVDRAALLERLAGRGRNLRVVYPVKDLLGIHALTACAIEFT